MANEIGERGFMCGYGDVCGWAMRPLVRQRMRVSRRGVEISKDSGWRRLIILRSPWVSTQGVVKGGWGVRGERERVERRQGVRVGSVTVRRKS